ncbi:PE-PPE domain-containing protein [Mycobacterium sp.]|uniref:PE family protein n=1 Tax=Mycobacterium sp. TaxID=1785 RepID=UPI000CC5CDF2|nr:PE-PPE domain-containing protein [Mycobacterium sp.]PJE06784.1 MAG: PE family protein [Mycobacterium sp.]
MTYVIAQPQIIATAVTDIEGIGSAVSAAGAAAAAPTSNLLAAAADEVSAAVAQFFGGYGTQFQTAVAQLEAFRGEFGRLLAAAGFAYTEAEVTNSATIAATPLAGPTVSLIMGGSGTPLPPPKFVAGVLNYISTQFGATTAQVLYTPEQLYPLTGAKSLPLNTSLTQGVAMLHEAIMGEIGRGNSVVALGYSQSAIIASIEMRHLAAMPGAPAANQLGFVLLANPMNPNGGLLSRFAGLTLPSIGLDFLGATPSDTIYPTSIYTYEYDGFADFPRYPLNIVSDLNAIAGIALVHSKTPYVNIDSLPPGDLVQLPTSPGYTGNTTYYIIRNHQLPLLTPLRAIPMVGNPLADLMEPSLRTIVNLGYGDPNYGYSTTAADVPTPFGLFPPIDPVRLSGTLVLGAQHGVTTAAINLTAPPAPAELDVSALGLFQSYRALPAPSPELITVPTSIPGFIGNIQAANTYIADTFTTVTSQTYAVLLPTADILNAGATTLPSYGLNLFLDGIEQAVEGDPMGLVNAVGRPIAATTALLSAGLGLEALVVMGALVKDF